jgi:hypothetical protein
MSIRLNEPIRQLIKERHGIVMGSMIGDGYFSNVYSIRGDKSRVIKVTICDASLRFARMTAKSENPHFPKLFSFLGKVGIGKNDEGTGYEAFAYLTERLKPIRWHAGSWLDSFYHHTREYTSRQVTGVETVWKIRDCVHHLNELREEFNAINDPLIDAFKELQSYLQRLNRSMRGRVGLDLHRHNYMMRGGNTLVINDPVFNRARID